jgi:glycosyltransferase involved in cell wall biosynthesis
VAVVAIDARELTGRATGVGRFLSHLLAAWATLPEARGHEYLLYVPAVPPSAFAWTTRANRAPADQPPLAVRIREVPGGSGSWWEQVRLPAALRRDGPDVLFSPAYTAPLVSGVPLVLALHDVSFLAHPEWFPPRTRVRRRLIATLAARRAASILTISRFSAGEIVSRLHVAPERVSVVPLAPGGPVVPGGLPREPLVLFVGSIFNRRHVPELIQACARVARRHPEIRLVVVGEDRTYPGQDLRAAAEASGLGDRLSLLSYVPDEDLAALYGRASVFAFLSDYEGFGLTPVEALAAGVPAVLGDTPVAREVCGDAACYVPTGDVGAIAAALEAALFDRPTRDRLLGAVPATLAKYSWDRAGRDTLAVLLHAARGRS